MTDGGEVWLTEEARFLARFVGEATSLKEAEVLKLADASVVSRHAIRPLAM